MKVKQKKASKITLSDKIADALTVKPRADIEDDHVFNTKPKTLTRADFSSSESEDEAAISDFRKRNVHLLSDISKKYEGEVVSRKRLTQSDDRISEESDSGSEENEDIEKADSSGHEETKEDQSVDSESDESDDYSITQFKKQLHSDDDEQTDDDETGSEDGEEKEDGEGYDISQMEEPMKENFEHVKKQNVSEEAKKGNCVRNQLLLWEGLLEMRIHLQRCMNSANRMPMSECYKMLKEDQKFASECVNTVSNVAGVLDKLLTLQSLLFRNFPETKDIATNKQKSEQKPKDEDEEIPSDTDNEEIPSDTEPEDNIETEKAKPKKNEINLKKKRKLEDYESELSTSHKSFKSFRDTTIQKWNDKTKLANAANMKNTSTNTILQQISYILSDRPKLVRRTQLKRSEYDIIGYNKEVNSESNENGSDLHTTNDRKENDEYIPEIFDDSDFYHQLLRELIECKSADITDPVQLSRQWIALQQMRSKMKRKVDTKATKGRKIKYVIHNQLVNYMAPEKCLTWSDESTNELYSSLFGKMYEQNSIGVHVNLENGK